VPPDELDLRLLHALAATTRPSALELSRRLGVARGTVQARLDRLKAAGVIEGYGAHLDLRALGYQVLAFTTLEIAQGSEGGVIAALRAIDEVLEVHKTTGPGDLLCRVVARTNEHLHDVLERVLAIEGIARTTTALALTSPVERVRVTGPVGADDR
jgi:DNA-binding Lrp family transcriptional regulator